MNLKVALPTFELISAFKILVFGGEAAVIVTWWLVCALGPPLQLIVCPVNTCVVVPTRVKPADPTQCSSQLPRGSHGVAELSRASNTRPPRALNAVIASKQP
jgi:hypothetical protein